ncbi:MAG: agmatinase, partial [Candidatus Kapaibacterium sp.]
MISTIGIDGNFLAIEPEYSNYEKSEIAIISAPYEHTVSYGEGAGRGPEAILDASAYVEFYDDECRRELCFEKGIATLEAIDFKGKTDKTALDMIENLVDQTIRDGKFAVTLGGEHTISTAPIAAHFKHYPTMSLLHFDAHSDLRDSYQGTKYSHASFMARVAEFFPSERITQVGIRAQCKEEAEFIEENKINTFYASAIRRGLHGSNWQQQVVDSLGDTVYCTFDVDYFDPAIMAATGTPEPDGFMYSETIDIFRLFKKSG